MTAKGQRKLAFFVDASHIDKRKILQFEISPGGSKVKKFK